MPRSTTHNGALLAADLLHGPGAQGYFLKDLELTMPRVPLYTAPQACSGTASNRKAVSYSATGSVSRKTSRKYPKSTFESLGTLDSPADPWMPDSHPGIRQPVGDTDPLVNYYAS